MNISNKRNKDQSQGGLGAQWFRIGVGGRYTPFFQMNNGHEIIYQKYYITGLEILYNITWAWPGLGSHQTWPNYSLICLLWCQLTFTLHFALQRGGERGVAGRGGRGKAGGRSATPGGTRPSRGGPSLSPGKDWWPTRKLAELFTGVWNIERLDWPLKSQHCQ